MKFQIEFEVEDIRQFVEILGTLFSFEVQMFISDIKKLEEKE